MARAVLVDVPRPAKNEHIAFHMRGDFDVLAAAVNPGSGAK
jgi:hypothetical protein